MRENKMKKMIALILLIGASVFAEPVVWDFTGRIASVNNGTNILSVYTLGDILSGSIVVDVAEGVLDDSNSTYSTYSIALQSLWFDNGVQDIGFETRGLIDVSNDNFGRDDMRFYHDTSGQREFVGDSINGLSLFSIILTLEWPEDEFSDNSLSEIDFGSITTWGLQVTYSKSIPMEPIQNEYMYITPAVPEPATAMMLFFGGGIGFVIHRLRRWANR